LFQSQILPNWVEKVGKIEPGKDQVFWMGLMNVWWGFFNVEKTVNIFKMFLKFFHHTFNTDSTNPIL
jgi:hypothetical protein